MPKRLIRSLIILVTSLVACAATWAMSWLVQFICSVTIYGPRFHLESQASNRLAAITILAVVVVMIGAVLFQIFGSDAAIGLVVIVLTFNIFLVYGLVWVGEQSFRGTTVSTPLAGLAYTFFVLVWGAGMWWMLLENLVESLF
jgi:hypothetical protein